MKMQAKEAFWRIGRYVRQFRPQNKKFTQSASLRMLDEMATDNSEKSLSGFKRVFSKSREDFGLVEAISESGVGVMMAFVVKAVGVANTSEIPELIILCLGGAIITPFFGFLIRLIFITPYRIIKDDEAEIKNLTGEIRAFKDSKPQLELLAAATDKDIDGNNFVVLPSKIKARPEPQNSSRLN